MYQIMCHCASQDCSNCPMKNTGTVGVLAEYDFFHNYNENNENNENNKSDDNGNKGK